MVNPGVIFVIEHLEPRLSKWCMIEYTHISNVVKPKNLWFTNVVHPSKDLKCLGNVFSKPASTLPMERPCVLDPEAKKELLVNEKNAFSHLIFGGILGNDPPQKRTRDLLDDRSVDRRNLGSHQMSTDTAVVVAQKILHGTPLSDMTFVDSIEIHLATGESVILPYRYLADRGKVLLPAGLRGYLQSKRAF